MYYKKFLLGLALLVSPYTFSHTVSVEFLDFVEAYVDILEQRYQPVIGSLKQKAITKICCNINEARGLEGRVPKCSLPSLDSVLNTLLKIQTLLTTASNVLGLAHKVIDGVDVLIKKLAILRKTFMESFNPKQEEPIPSTSETSEIPQIELSSIL